jgi:hypothetical protein
MNNKWTKSANNYFLREVSQQVNKLEPAIYKVEAMPMSGELYLSHVQDKYDFPYKVYGMESGFISRVKRTYDNTNGNLGILLNGVKGTGKTVTAKQICNKMNLPVIVVSAMFENIPGFINSIQQDIVIFVDEYEKIYADRDHSVLTIMDGALDNGFRRIFLLTTNNLYINDNMIQRPGRIRYLKTYNDLSRSAIEEIVDDKLQHTELREVTIEFISQLELITVDIVKAIIDEVNIHNEDPKEFKDVFNIKVMDNKYNVYEVIPGEAIPKLITPDARIRPIKFDQDDVGRYFEVNGWDKGRIISVSDEENIAVGSYDDEKETQVITHYKVEPAKQYHRSFAF